MKRSIPPQPRLLSLFLLPLLILSAIHSHADSPIRLQQAWIAEAPPTSKVMAAYMDIQNSTAQAIEISTIASPDFSSIEIHRSVEENGVARMLRQSTIKIKAGDHFLLAPGGYHLMLFNPSTRLRAGDSSQLRFNFGDGSHAEFTVTVKKAGDTHHHGHH